MARLRRVHSLLKPIIQLPSPTTDTFRPALTRRALRTINNNLPLRSHTATTKRLHPCRTNNSIHHYHQHNHSNPIIRIIRISPPINHTKGTNHNKYISNMLAATMDRNHMSIQGMGFPGYLTTDTAMSVANNHANSIARPPETPQQFGNGAPNGYAFQYSQCTGKRKALLIGINYYNQRGQLRGCINDVRNMAEYLVLNYGYKREDMVILTDDQKSAISQPTKANILRAMHWLVKNAQPNDSLFFHYSGHGGQTRDLDGDEDDGYDEVIYPVDFRTNSHITDDEMHHIMVQPLQAGVRLTAIFDSCHSGTALDLPYIYSTQGILKEPNLAKEAGQGLLNAISSYTKGDLNGVAHNIMGFIKKAKGGDEAHARSLATKTSPADVIMLSGSKDDQTSADATIASQATGAMSWAFIEALRKNPQQSYVQLLNSIRDTLATRYSQRPQLSSSHPLDTNLLFVM
ncbi:Peptidase C14, caspase catalytic [Niveomyces insectorum RCEF 264]|uniref:Peptidase C14, caspase catalytic n=1 Tax=Niveomyces insectorum RCEF 264 TaxID=1081102 RepID=A0A167X8F6_9HYPO|nr:Peptidase C14, caspase catalytic [Niveomyces insectorum RCEF 264]